MAFILNDSTSKVLLIGEEFLGHLKQMELEGDPLIVIIGDPGTTGYAAFEQWIAGREERDPAVPSQPRDTCYQLYTSGTTGKPKGVMLSYDNIIITSCNAAAREGLQDDEEIVSYLPMAWVGDHILSYGQFYCTGFTVNCPESGATVLQDLHDIGPTYFFAPPRIWESILTTVMIRIEDAAWIKRKMFHYFMDVAQRVGTRKLAREPITWAERLLYGLGHVLIYGPLKDNLGFSRIRMAYTAGEAIGP